MDLSSSPNVPRSKAPTPRLKVFWGVTRGKDTLKKMLSAIGEAAGKTAYQCLSSLRATDRRLVPQPHF
jgi:hypothetical protein